MISTRISLWVPARVQIWRFKTFLNEQETITSNIQRGNALNMTSDEIKHSLHSYMRTIYRIIFELFDNMSKRFLQEAINK